MIEASRLLSSYLGSATSQSKPPFYRWAEEIHNYLPLVATKIIRGDIWS